MRQVGRLLAGSCWIGLLRGVLPERSEQNLVDQSAWAFMRQVGPLLQVPAAFLMEAFIGGDRSEES